MAYGVPGTTAHIGCLAKFASVAAKDGEAVDLQPAFTNWDMFFNAKSGNGSVGAQFLYDHVSGKGSSEMGATMKHADHTWKFRFNSSGLARAALQWNLHKACKATLNTSVNVKEFAAGTVSSVPLGLSLEIKY